MTARKEHPQKRGAKPRTIEQSLGVITFDVAKVKRIARFGCTDVQLGKVLGVDERTIRLWKEKHPEFRSALKEAKDEADALVEKSLFERARGYKHKAVKIFFDKDGLTTDEDNNLVDNRVVLAPYIEHYPPDATSAIFWLKNRQPDKWREKQEVEVTEGVKVIRDDV